jgi:CRP-like cAMP-binding protein
LRDQQQRIDNTEQFNLLRHLSFFHDFSVEEIREIQRAGEWREYAAGNEIVRQGDIDDRFYVIVNGKVEVESNGKAVGHLGNGDCFGEASYVADAKRTSTIRAADGVTILSVSATLLEQVSTACQLRFTRVFLGEMIRRLQGSSN